MDILPRLYERDIDVLIHEEVIFNGATRALLANALNLESLGAIEFCQLSVVDNTGETDLLISALKDAEKVAYLIENKIDASFQPRQPERYRERAVQLTLGEYTRAFCILIAPSTYKAPREMATQFDTIISYEKLAESISSEDTPRARHRASIVMRAVEQARKSYVLIPADNTTDFWKRIYEIASKRFPQLKMKSPATKGSNSNWISFKADLPAKITIDWKISKSSVELSFWPGSKVCPPSVDASILPEGSSFGAVGKGGTFSIKIPQSPVPLDWTTISDEQIGYALQQASRLLDFFHKRIAT